MLARQVKPQHSRLERRSRRAVVDMARLLVLRLVETAVQERAEPVVARAARAVAATVLWEPGLTAASTLALAAAFLRLPRAAVVALVG